MKFIDISYGEYASKWGIADFYEESAEKLKSAIESGEDFDTGWFGCKKEIRYAHIERCEDDFTIEVSAHMDDLWESEDLIYDALWHVSKSEEELPEEIIDSIRDACIDCEIDDNTTLSETIPSAEATFEKVVEILVELESMTEKNNEDMFKRLCGIVENHFIYLKSLEEE